MYSQIFGVNSCGAKEVFWLSAHFWERSSFIIPIKCDLCQKCFKHFVHKIHRFERYSVSGNNIKNDSTDWNCLWQSIGILWKGSEGQEHFGIVNRGVQKFTWKPQKFDEFSYQNS